MNVKYIDAHCHLQFDQYAQDRDEIIERMREEGISAIVVGTDYKSSKEALALAEKYEHLFASIGLHPSHAATGAFDTEPFCQLASHPKVVAIGECGLDYFHLEMNEEARNVQKEIFQKQIELAAELNKPLIIHTRSSKGANDAYQDLITMLKEAKTKFPKLRGDIHFFVGSLIEAEQFLALDFTISFTAVITFARDYDALIRAVPLTGILCETDAPYVAPAARRGQRNDPFAVIDIVQQIAHIRGENPESIRAALLANVRRLFALQVA